MTAPKLLSILFALVAVAAAAPTLAVRPAGHLAELMQFLDRTTPAPRRQEIFAAWREAALAGDTDAQYVVGTILRRGDNADPPLVPRDADQARRCLSTAAGHGRLLAMAKMAELELAEDRPFEAMIWTQIYGVYRGWVRNGNLTDYGDHNEREPTLYFEDLLGRVTERMRQKLGSLRSRTLQQLNAPVAAHDKDVRADLWRRASRRAGPALA
jgi:TPR repeat protein